MGQSLYFDINLLGMLNFRALYILAYKQFVFNATNMVVSDVCSLVTT